jgi:hypothetical protein
MLKFSQKILRQKNRHPATKRVAADAVVVSRAGFSAWLGYDYFFSHIQSA